MTDSYFTLRNNASLSYEPPSDPQSGNLWVEASTMRMYVYDPTNLADGGTGWIGITSSQNTGSICYVGDRAPRLTDIYENLDNIYPYVPDQQLDPLPGTMWFDTYNKVLKIWYVDSSQEGSWVGITTSHYLSEAVSAKVTTLNSSVDELTQKVNALKAALEDANA
jgi:hypothetical protein